MHLWICLYNTSTSNVHHQKSLLHHHLALACIVVLALPCIVTLTLPCIVTLFPTRTRLGKTSERYSFVILLFAALCISFSQVTLSRFLELAALYVVFRTSKPQSLPCQAALLHCAPPQLEDWQIPGLKLVQKGILYGMREQMCIS